MAALRNLAISLLRLAGETNLAAACRRCAAQPWAALGLTLTGFQFPDRLGGKMAGVSR